MLDKKLAKNIDFKLNTRFNIDFNQCKYLNGYQYIKLFYGDYCIYYNKKTDHIEHIYNISLHLNTKNKLFN